MQQGLTIVSMLSANQYIFLRPKKRAKEADDKKRTFNDYKVERDERIHPFLLHTTVHLLTEGRKIT